MTLRPSPSFSHFFRFFSHHVLHEKLTVYAFSIEFSEVLVYTHQDKGILENQTLNTITVTDNEKPHKVSEGVYVMWLESVIFTLGLLGLAQLARDGGVMPVLLSTIAVGFASSAVLFLACIGLLQAHLTDQQPRRFLHLQFHPRDVTISLLQVGVHVLVALCSVVASLVIATWSAEDALMKQYFVFLFAGRVQQQTTMTGIRVGVVVFLAATATTLIVVWVFFVVARGMLSDLTGARAHLMGLAQVFLFLLFFTQHALNDASQRACGGLSSACTLNDMPPLTRSDSVLKEAAVALAGFLVLDVLAERGVDEYRRTKNWVWFLIYVTTRVVLVSGVVLFYFLFLESMLEFDTLNWVAMGILLAFVTIEIVGAVSVKKEVQTKSTTPVVVKSKQMAPFFDPISVGTQQPVKTFLRNSRSRRKTE